MDHGLRGLDSLQIQSHSPVSMINCQNDNICGTDGENFDFEFDEVVETVFNECYQGKFDIDILNQAKNCTLRELFDSLVYNSKLKNVVIDDTECYNHEFDDLQSVDFGECQDFKTEYYLNPQVVELHNLQCIYYDLLNPQYTESECEEDTECECEVSQVDRVSKNVGEELRKLKSELSDVTRLDDVEVEPNLSDVNYVTDFDVQCESVENVMEHLSDGARETTKVEQMCKPADELLDVADNYIGGTETDDKSVSHETDSTCICRDQISAQARQAYDESATNTQNTFQIIPDSVNEIDNDINKKVNELNHQSSQANDGVLKKGTDEIDNAIKESEENIKSESLEIVSNDESKVNDDTIVHTNLVTTNTTSEDAEVDNLKKSESISNEKTIDTLKDKKSGSKKKKGKKKRSALQKGVDSTVYIINANKDATFAECKIKYDIDNNTLMIKKSNQAFEISVNNLVANFISKVNEIPILIKVSIIGQSTVMVFSFDDPKIANEFESIFKIKAN